MNVSNFAFTYEFSQVFFVFLVAKTNYDYLTPIILQIVISRNKLNLKKYKTSRNSLWKKQCRQTKV